MPDRQRTSTPKSWSRQIAEIAMHAETVPKQVDRTDLRKIKDCAKAFESTGNTERVMKSLIYITVNTKEIRAAAEVADLLTSLSRHNPHEATKAGSAIATWANMIRDPSTALTPANSVISAVDQIRTENGDRASGAIIQVKRMIADVEGAKAARSIPRLRVQ